MKRREKPHGKTCLKRLKWVVCVSGGSQKNSCDASLGCVAGRFAKTSLLGGKAIFHVFEEIWKFFDSRLGSTLFENDRLHGIYSDCNFGCVKFFRIRK